MPGVWLCSDHHFGHEKTCTVFKRNDGTPLRPFSSAEEMDEELVRRHNERVRKNDKCYFLGDVVIAKKNLAILNRLNGDKVLIRGNHDIYKLQDYAEYFRDIRGYHVMNGLILSHIPIHLESLARFRKNIHGHLHANQVMKLRGVNVASGELLYSDQVDPRYYNVSVERTNFAPILFEDLLQKIKERDEELNFKEHRPNVLGVD